jgi:hypothetical protein
LRDGRAGSTCGLTEGLVLARHSPIRITPPIWRGRM